VGVRPEDVKLIASGDIAGRLYGAEDHGVEMILTIQVADQLVRATSAATTRVPVNAPVQIAFAQDKLHFFDPETTKNLAQT
jgi:ABC-type sugar transport system ATPase subunit